MTQGRPLSVLLGFALPIYIGNIFQQLYNWVDTMIVGRFVGQGALAAVGSTGTIMFLIWGFSSGLTTGFTVLTAQSFGAGDEKRVRHSVANGILLSAIVIVLTTVFSMLSARGLLELMNTPADIIDDAYVYTVTICGGIVASVMYNLFSASLRAVGNSRIPLLFLVISAVTNIVLDLFFIIFLKLGVFGAALATDLSQALAAVGCVIYIITREPALRPTRKDWHLNRADTDHQLRMGVPMALQFAITASGTMVMQASINLFGSVAVASFTAASKLVTLLTQGMPAFGQTMASYCGQNYGKGDIVRLKRGVFLINVINAVYSLMSLALTWGLLPLTAGIFFSGDAQLADILGWARPYAYVCMTCYIPLGMIFIYRNAMQGCGYGFLPMLGGVVELIARFLVAFISMRMESYLLAVSGDAVAWLAAGIYTFIAWHVVVNRITRQREQAA